MQQAALVWFGVRSIVKVLDVIKGNGSVVSMEALYRCYLALCGALKVWYSFLVADFEFIHVFLMNWWGCFFSGGVWSDWFVFCLFLVCYLCQAWCFSQYSI